MRRLKAVPIIILLNIGVFVLWNYGSESYAPILETYFLVSWSLLQQGYWLSLIGSVFSHNMFLHLFFNMFVLHSFGSVIEQLLGPRRFLIFYIIAGCVSSLSHSLVTAFVMDQPELAALGASGSVAGIVLLFSLLFPRQKILLFGVIPLPAIVGALLFIGLDIWGLMAQAHGGGLPIGHGAHLGGAASGILYYFMFLRKKWRHHPLRQMYN